MNVFMYMQWLKYKKFGVGTPIRERLATPIRDVGTLICQKLEVWERRSRPFPLTLNTVYMYVNICVCACTNVYMYMYIGMYGRLSSLCTNAPHIKHISSAHVTK